jgi:hypothetical protein
MSEPIDEDRANRRIPWTAEEDELILKTVEAYGSRWQHVAAHLPRRSGNGVRNRYHRIQKDRCLKAGRPVATRGYHCRRCGQPKRGHQCTDPDGDGSAPNIEDDVPDMVSDTAEPPVSFNRAPSAYREGEASTGLPNGAFENWRPSALAVDAIMAIDQRICSPPVSGSWCGSDEVYTSVGAPCAARVDPPMLHLNLSTSTVPAPGMERVMGPRGDVLGARGDAPSAEQRLGVRHLDVPVGGASLLGAFGRPGLGILKVEPGEIRLGATPLLPSMAAALASAPRLEPCSIHEILGLPPLTSIPCPIMLAPAGRQELAHPGSGLDRALLKLPMHAAPAVGEADAYLGVKPEADAYLRVKPEADVYFGVKPRPDVVWHPCGWPTPFSSWVGGDEDAFVKELGLTLDFPRGVGSHTGTPDGNHSSGGFPEIDQAPSACA